MKLNIILSTIIFFLMYETANTQNIISTVPAANSVNVSRDANIKVKFDTLMDGSSFTTNTFIVNGLRMGLIGGSISYTDTDSSLNFTPSKNFCAGEMVTVVLTKDIKSKNGTHPDNAYSFSYTVTTTNGSGIFAPKTDYAIGSTTVTLFSSDFDGDGDMDIVAQCAPSSTSVFLNTGDGTFSGKVDYATNGSYSVFSSDVDLDGDMDLLVTNGAYNVSVLLNKGNGTFSAKFEYITGIDPCDVYSSDFDLDGDMDIATMNRGSNTVSILLNKGDGTFGLKTDFATGNRPQSVVASDLDLDGDMDIVTTNGGSNTVSILLNKGDGTFANKVDYNTNGSKSVFAADLDLDGDMDLAVVGGGANGTVLLNNGDGTFAGRMDYITGSSPFSVFSSDFDSDGDMDLATANWGYPSVSLLMNNGDGTFAEKVDYGTESPPHYIFSSDFDGDGDMDLATANHISGTVTILLNRNKLQDIKFSANSHNFGSVAKNASESWDLKIYNSGLSGNLVISNITSGASYLTIDKTSGTFAPDSSITVTVTFTPTGIGNYSDSIAISSNDPDNPTTYVHLSGVCGTFVSGFITENTTWTKANNPYVVNGNLTINPDVTLTIEPGVEVKFNGSFVLTVNGNLAVNGTASERILFTSVFDPGPGNWNKLYFSSTGSGNLNYLNFQAATDGIYAENAKSLSITNSIIEQNSNYGIYLNLTSATIRNSLVQNNGTGIYGISSSPAIDSCNISSNKSNGLYFSNTTCSPYITGSTISDNNGCGIYYYNGWGLLKLINNRITGNANWGVYIEGASPSTETEVKNNIINTNAGGICSKTNTAITNNTISKNYGDGISATHSAVTIKYNTIMENNGEGIETTTNNLIDQNTVSGNVGDGIKALASPGITNNVIKNNGSDGIETNALPTINHNDFAGNTGYTVRATSQGTQTINAENNYWGTSIENTIKAKIWDYSDDGSLVKVDYTPYYTGKVELLPVPGFSSQALAGGKIRLSWDVHTQASRYLLFYDNLTGTIDTATVWVNLDSTCWECTVTLPDGNYKLGIKALTPDGRKSPIDSSMAIADGTPPVMLSATGNTGHNMINVIFDEGVLYTSVTDTSNWHLSHGLSINNVNGKAIVREPVAYWNFDEGDGDVLNDLSGNGNHGEIYGANWVAGKYGTALSFDGLDDYVSVPHNTSLKPSTRITIKAWVKPTDIHTSAYCEIYRKDDGEARHLLSFQDYGTILAFGINAGGIYNELDVPVNRLDFEGKWVHIAATYDGIHKTVYVNGVEVGITSATGTIGTSGDAPAIIGSSGGGEFFNGIIDELAIYDYALTAEEVREHYLGAGKNEIILTLRPGQSLPSPDTEITITCNNIEDILGNQSQADTIILTIHPLPSADIADSTNVTCHGYFDGSAIAKASGGSPPYTYRWDDPLNTRNSVVTDLSANRYYHVTVTDNNGCSVMDSVMLSEPAPIDITAEYADKICLNSSNGYINISVSGGASPYSYIWSNDSASAHIGNLTAGEYSVMVTDSIGCFETDTITIASSEPFSDEEICLVTVNEANINTVVWEKTPARGIVAYKIYRETTEVGNYELTGTVPYDSLSVFVDSTSNARQRSYQYKLSVIDTCGNESEKSFYHRSMLLKVNVGINVYNLEWDDYIYEGGGFTFSKFYIYRGPSADTIQLIDSIGANYLTYIDDNPPEGLLFYQVAGVKADGCSPSAKKKSGSDENYTLSFTNIEDNGVIGIDETKSLNQVTISPNPFTSKTRIEFPNADGNRYKLIITNISGKTFRIIENITTSTVEVEKGFLPEGLYLIELRGDNVYRGKIVIAR